MRAKVATAVIAVIAAVLLVTAVILAVLLSRGSGAPTSATNGPASAAAGPPASASAPYLVTVRCDGNASDAATLQRAINGSPPGAVIDIQGGTCLLTQGISLPGDRTYTGGATTGTVLKQGAHLAYMLASAAYVGNSSTTGGPLAIRDLTVSCDGSGGTDGIIVLNWQTDVQHVDVSGCGGSGIVDTNTTANGQAITNTSVNSRFDNNLISGSGQYGFEVSDSGNAVSDGFLEGNQIASSAKDAIHIDNAAGWVISGNHVYGDHQDGIYADRLFGTTISDNYVEDFGAGQRSGTWYGIAGAASGSVGSAISGNKVFNIRGETAGARYFYIAVQAGGGQAGGGTGYVSVTGNVIVGTGRGDVGFLFGGGPQKLVVASSGNVVVGVGTPRKNAGGVTVTGGI